MAYEKIVVNDKLVLRQLQPVEGQELFALINRNRAYLSKWLVWVKTTQSVQDTVDFINSILTKRNNDSEYGYGIFFNDQLVGHISLMHLKEDKPEIGYWITEDAAGQGIMTKSVGALTRFGLDDLHLPKIIICAETSNAASNRIAEKLGYQLRGLEYNERIKQNSNTWEITGQLRDQ